MNTSLQYNGQLYESVVALIGALPDDSFNSARRSTLPLMDYWRQPTRGLEELRRLTGFSLAEPIGLHFEYAVSPLRGRGKASFTDLMVISEDSAVAIEAKFTEPLYDPVSMWLGDSSENRVNVLTGWIDSINRAAEVTLAIPDIVTLPYQLIHRTASACSVAVPNRAVVYQTFGDPPINHYADAIARLVELGVTRSVKVIEMDVTTRPTLKLMEIERTFAKGTPALRSRLREALAVGCLYTFPS